MARIYANSWRKSRQHIVWWNSLHPVSDQSKPSLSVLPVWKNRSIVIRKIWIIIRIESRIKKRKKQRKNNVLFCQSRMHREHGSPTSLLVYTGPSVWYRESAVDIAVKCFTFYSFVLCGLFGVPFLTDPYKVYAPLTL